jgi:hypothetical protein
MANKIVLTMVAADILYLVSGALMLGFCLIVKNSMNDAPTNGEQAARNLLYREFPLDAGIGNAVFIFFTFAATVPGILLPGRTWLKISGWLLTISGIYSMCIGLFLWVLTLQMKPSFFNIWTSQEPSVQDLMQTSVGCFLCAEVLIVNYLPASNWRRIQLLTTSSM